MKKLYTITCFLTIFVGQLSDFKDNKPKHSLEREQERKHEASFTPTEKQDKIKDVTSLNEHTKHKYFYIDHCIKEWDKNISIKHEDFKNMIKKKLGPIVYSYMKGEEVSLIDKEPQTKEELFFMGLAFANFIANASDNYVDYEKAEKYLTMSYQKDTKNSAPLAFLALIKKKQGEESNVRKILKKVKATTYFSAYALDINNKILKQVKEPDDYLVHVKFIETQHFPKLGELSNMLKEEKDHVIANQLIANALNPKAKFKVDFDPFYYMFGRSILRNISNVNLPDSNVLWSKARKEVPYMKHDIHLDSTCKIEDMASYVKLHQSYAFN